MNSLRFLLVHGNQEHSDAIAELLTRANHSVLPLPSLKEAADALTVERFDAVLMGSEFRNHGLPEFSAEMRRLEQSQRSPTHIPIIALDGAGTGSGLAGGSVENDGLDGVISEPIDPETLTATVIKLAHAVENKASQDASSSIAILDPEKFKEQVGYDDELMVEIIDLFLDERKRQEPEMRDALLAKKFDQLSRAAHTIKGSLGSLHALRARAHAQTLELAAKDGDEDICWESLAALEADLVDLEPELRTLRGLVG